MDRRARQQLRLQQTVEGLSVAAITYYVVGLIAYAAKALSDTRLPIRDDVVIGIAVPLVAAAVFLRRAASGGGWSGRRHDRVSHRRVRPRTLPAVAGGRVEVLPRGIDAAAALDRGTRHRALCLLPRGG